jgi:Ala-tRNA(Pro) deacylase
MPVQEEDHDHSMKLFNSICNLLDNARVSYRKVHHQPTPTCEDSANQRGEDLSIGGKAILLKFDDTYYHLFVLSAAKKINSKLLKAFFNAKKIRFATTDELFRIYRLVPGSVPPFGEPILTGLKLFLDKAILKNQKIAFNAGSLTNSIVMNMEDYLKVASPQVIEFTEY